MLEAMTIPAANKIDIWIPSTTPDSFDCNLKIELNKLPGVSIYDYVGMNPDGDRNLMGHGPRPVINYLKTNQDKIGIRITDHLNPEESAEEIINQ